MQNKEAVKELFDVIAPRVADRPGGYVRVIKTGFRQGDNADMCMIELVDFNETMLNATEEDTGKKRTRRSRRRKSNEEAANVQETTNETEEVTEE